MGGFLTLEAIEDRIIIMLDAYKSGYECKDCDGTGIFKACECMRASGILGEKANGKSCNADIRAKCSTQTEGTPCKTCNGTGSTLVVPQTARAIPTSGKIVSVGPRCKTRVIGERVLFGSHTGYFLPFKGNAQLRSMREDEPLCLLSLSTDEHKEVAMGDFMEIDENPPDSRET